MRKRESQRQNDEMNSLLRSEELRFLSRTARGDRWSHEPPIPKTEWPAHDSTDAPRFGYAVRTSVATRVGRKNDAGLKSSLRWPIVDGSGPPQKADPTLWRTKKRIKNQPAAFGAEAGKGKSRN